MYSKWWELLLQVYEIFFYNWPMITIHILQYCTVYMYIYIYIYIINSKANLIKTLSLIYLTDLTTLLAFIKLFN